MRDKDEDAELEALDEGPSKSEVKRQMLARQALGEQLTRLNDKQLALLPIGDERLLAAIRETRNIRSKNALKRHLQFVGKLMREVDPAPIEAALETMRRPARQQNEVFHQLEQLRDEALTAGVTGVELVLKRWPEADRQQLRQLILQHQRETQRGKPPAASRKLFRYLRELQEIYGS
jgi:ribosome-associated protein